MLTQRDCKSGGSGISVAALAAGAASRSKFRGDFMFGFIRTLGLVAAFAFSALHLAQAQTTTPIRLGYIPVMGVAQIFVAEGEGWTKEKGLDIKFASFESGPNMIQALASGTLDVYVAGLAPLLVARAPFFPGGKGTAAGFKAFREKAGRPAKLATQPIGSGPNATLQYWLWEKLKADKADIDIIEMG